MNKNLEIQRNIFSYMHTGAAEMLSRIQVILVRTTANYTII